jgi:hypothetical protein
LLADIASSELITAENKNAKGVGRESFPTIVLGRRKGKVAKKKSKKEGMQELRHKLKDLHRKPNCEIFVTGCAIYFSQADFFL